MAAAVGRIMDGEATPAQIGALLIALRMKGETVDEVVGAARGDARARARRCACRRAWSSTPAAPAATARGTFNVSTLAALVVAAAGVRVAKHGNRAQSSRSGSADVLEALGVDLARAGRGGRALPRRGRHRLPVRARRSTAPPSTRRRRAGARRAHALQPARAADQPGGRAPPGHRRLRLGARRAAGARARAARLRARAGGARRRPRRVRAERRHRGGRAARRRGQALPAAAARLRPRRGGSARARRRRRRRPTPARRARSSAARAAPDAAPWS